MNPLATTRLEAPQRSDLLPVEQVEALVRTADLELTQLEREAADATAAADAMQRRVVDEGADERSSSWGMMQLRRFLDELSEEVDREVAALVDVAERWSKQRLTEAHAEAEAVRRGERTGHDVEATAVPASGPARPAPRTAVDRSFLVPEPITVPAAPESVTEVPSEPVLVEELSSAAVVPPPISFDIREISVVPDASSTSDAKGSVAQATPAAPVPTVAASEPVVEDGAAPIIDGLDGEGPAAAVESPTTTSTPGEGDIFWTQSDKVEKAKPEAAKPERKRRSKLGRRIPWTAVLQVLAVLLILAFILLRLG